MATRTYRDLYPTRERWVDPAWFDLYADLSEENDDNPGCCRAHDHATDYGCTREPNHSGPHIADDGDDVLSVWNEPASDDPAADTTIPSTTPSDTTLLDWIASLPTDPDYSRWQFRRSTSGRGWLLHTTSGEPNYATPREALIAAFEDCRQEIAALDRVLGDDEENEPDEPDEPDLDRNDWGGDIS